jgi:hypothetical protein
VVDRIGAIVVDQQPRPWVVLLDLSVVPDRAAELLGRTDMLADTGRLGVRLFPTLDEAVGAHRDRPQPDRPPA